MQKVRKEAHRGSVRLCEDNFKWNNSDICRCPKRMKGTYMVGDGIVIKVIYIYHIVEFRRVNATSNLLCKCFRRVGIHT